jgi:hypothetical protein
MVKKTCSKANNLKASRLTSIPNVVFQNFDLALYIKEFIPAKHALPYYLVCKCTMSTSQSEDSDFNEIVTSIFGFCSPPALLRWAIDMHIPITRKLFAEVCSHGVLSDVKMLHKVYKCTWIKNALKKAISNGHLHILKYLCPEKNIFSNDVNLLFCYAIQKGKLDILQWICSTLDISGIEISSFQKACGKAAKSHHTDVLIWIKNNSFFFDWTDACKGAAKGGNVELLEYFYSHTHNQMFVKCEILINDAISHGQLNVLQWIESKFLQNPWTPNNYQLAAENGHLHILKWLYSQETSCSWTESTFNNAAFHKHKSITDWLQTIEPSCPFNELTLIYAARNGDLNLMKWLRFQNPPCPFSISVFFEALGSQNIEVLQWLVDNNVNCYWQSEYCTHAVLNNDFNTLKWLRSQNPPCPWKEDNLCTLAIGLGNLEMLQWLVSQNCLLNIDSFIEAATFGYLNILMWFRAHNPLSFQEMQYSLMVEASHSGHVHIMKWLRSFDPPCKWDKTISWNAARSSNLRGLIWMRSQDPPCPWDLYKLYKIALINDDIMLMKCLRSLDPAYQLPESLCAYAAEKGNLRMLRWLRCQEPPCPININRCLALAAKKGQVEVVSWLQGQSGCANCSRDKCRCKNSEIKIPEFYKKLKKAILVYRTYFSEEVSGSSSDDDSSSDHTSDASNDEFIDPENDNNVNDYFNEDHDQ